jgi:hypothetical protein
MVLSASDALIGGLLVAVLGLAGGCLTCWLTRRADGERLERLEDAVETLRRETRRQP